MAAGQVASRLPTARSASIPMTIAAAGTTGAGTTPISLAKAVHAHRPAAMPSGMPMTMATSRTVLVWLITTVRSCLRRGRPGPYQIQAAINAAHSDAPTAEATDWGQILQLYDQLLAVAPGPVVALNRAVAVAEVQGPAAALDLVDGLDLDRYYLYHAIRADLLRRLGRPRAAARAYEEALALTGNAAERAYLAARLADQRTS